MTQFCYCFSPLTWNASLIQLKFTSISSLQTQFKITYSESRLRLDPPDSDLSRMLWPIRTYRLCVAFTVAVVNVTLLLVLCCFLCVCFLPSQRIAPREKGPYLLLPVYTPPQSLPLNCPEVAVQGIPPKERNILRVKAESEKCNSFSW